MANVMRLGGGGGSGGTETLPPTITELRAVGGDSKITVTFKNPVSDALAGVLVVYNSKNIPTKPTNGFKVDAGMSETAIIEGLQNGIEYFIRIYPYNSKKQYQTLINGSTTSATPNIGPAQVTEFKVTGSGSSPVLSWKNPIDDPLYKETVVVQKVGSAPTNITDGTEIYRGAGTTVTTSNLVRLEEYYWAVFTIDEGGSYRTPVVSEMYSYDFPDKPTSYSEITKLYNTIQWKATEDGYFQFIGLAGSGLGGSGDHWSGGDFQGGGSGGSGGITVSVFPLYKGDIVFLSIAGNVSISHKEEVANAYQGGNGTKGIATGKVSGNPGTGGSAGSASGGNVANQNGTRGNNGTGIDQSRYSGGAPVENSYGGYSTKSGGGAYYYGHSNSSPGTNAYVVVLRGNTNIPSPSSASALSLVPRNASIEATWENSQDPESVGTMIVVNRDHEPTTPEDGTSVDVAEATSYTVTNLPNNKPSFISLFAYNADRTKYSVAKSDVEIPREVTWADTQDELEQDVAEKTEQLNQTTQELEENQVMVSSAASTLNLLIIDDIQNETKIVTDNMILNNADMLSKEWKTGVPNKVGDIVWYMVDDIKQYYKVVQPTDNADPTHTPNLVPAVFVPINKTNAGTIDDPIPAVRGMEYEYGKYYLDNEDGNVYICKRGEETGTIILQYLPHELIGQYFEEATTIKEE